MIELTDNQEREVQTQFEILSSNTSFLQSSKELLEKLRESIKNNSPLKVKLGLDPSAPDIHLGHFVVLKKLQQFQQLGHRVQLVIGDFTGRIGDPTGKSEARNQLSKEQINSNAKTYIEQFSKVLDMNHVEVYFNSEWSSKLSPADFIHLLSASTVARMLERNDFSQRFENHVPIYLHEFLYPLFQGYDSVALETDIELGGNDQQYNLLMGRKIQELYGQNKQVVMTMPLLVGLDGKMKMSKSKGNYIGVTDSADEMFGKVMSISDELMVNWFKLISTFQNRDIENFEKKLLEGVSPKELKVALAKNIIEQFYDVASAALAERHFNSLFNNKVIPDDIPEYLWESKELKVSVQDLFVVTGLLNSKSEVRRMIEGGGVKINMQKILNPEQMVDILNGIVLQVGKRKFVRLVFSNSNMEDENEI